MSDAGGAEQRSQRFAEAVRNFAGVPPKRFAALLPHRDGIAELRQKGASFGMIRELLAIAGIGPPRIRCGASTDTRLKSRRTPAPNAGRNANDPPRLHRCIRQPERLPRHRPSPPRRLSHPPKRHGPAAPASLIRATSNRCTLTL